MPSKKNAIIIGGGITGLATAFWLDRVGWETTILERAPAIREGGYVLGLTGPGYEAAKHMGLFERLDKIAYEMKENVIRDSSGHEIVRIKYTDAHGLKSIALRRGDLATILATTLPASATIRYNETATKFVDTGSKVEVTLTNGETISTDLLIGADGLHSSVRDTLFKCPCTPLQDLGYSFAVYDVPADGTLELPLDCVSYTRPSHLDFFYRMRNNRIAAMQLWCDDASQIRSIRNETTGNKAYAHLSRLAEGGHPYVRDMIQRAEAVESPVLIDTLTMVKLPTWSQGRVLLMGDAAHCLTLMSGQGASMAMVSAEILSQELQKSPDDILAALKNHESRLRPVICRLQAHSEDLARAYLPRNWLFYHLRNFFIHWVPNKWLIAWHIKKIQDEIELTKV